MPRPASTTVRWAASTIATVMVCAAVVAAGPAWAGALTVTSLADTSAPGTLRAALEAAEATPGDDVLTIAVTGTIHLTAQLPLITNGGITVEGPGSAALRIESTDQFAALAFSPQNGGSVTISGLTLAGTGSTISVDFGALGPEVEASLHLSDVVVDGAANTVAAPGVSIVGGESRPTVAIENSRFLNFSNWLMGSGAQISGAGEVTVRSSSFIGNSAAQIGGGLLLIDTTSALILNSTFSNNLAGSGGGAIFAGGLRSVDIVQSTFSGNSAADTGAAVLFVGVDTATIGHSTITANASDGAGGSAVTVLGGAVSIDSSIISGNTGATSDVADLGFLVPDFAARVELEELLDEAMVGEENPSALMAPLDEVAAARATPGAISYSLIGQPQASMDSGLWSVTDSLFALDAQLGALADNGGSTLTHLPAATSPAVGAGNLATLAGLETDQRGAARVVGGTVDLGAVEVQAATNPAAEMPATGSDARGALLLTVGLLIAGLPLLWAARRRSKVQA